MSNSNSCGPRCTRRNKPTGSSRPAWRRPSGPPLKPRALTPRKRTASSGSVVIWNSAWPPPKKPPPASPNLPRRSRPCSLLRTRARPPHLKNRRRGRPCRLNHPPRPNPSPAPLRTAPRSLTRTSRRPKPGSHGPRDGNAPGATTKWTFLAARIPRKRARPTPGWLRPRQDLSPNRVCQTKAPSLQRRQTRPERLKRLPRSKPPRRRTTRNLPNPDSLSRPKVPGLRWWRKAAPSQPRTCLPRSRRSKALLPARDSPALAATSKRTSKP